MKMTSIEESLPNDDEKILYLTNDNEFHIGYYDNKFKYWRCECCRGYDGDREDQFNVTHWTHLTKD
jgi:hypothetical protein